MTETDYPAMYRSADKLAVSQQKLFFITVRWQLIALTLAAIAAASTAVVVGLQMVQAVLLAAAFSGTLILLIGKPERSWYEARAVAESVKTMSWRFAMRAEPFTHDDPADREHLRRRLQVLRDLHRETAKLFSEDLAGEQITEAMCSLRAAALHERLERYRTERIDEQRGWYADKSRSNRRHSRAFFVFSIVTNALAVIAAATRPLWPGAPFWPTDILIAVSASIVAWLQANRFTELAASYALAAQEIGLVREQAAPKTDEELSRFVADAENAFSREHTQWVARQDS